MKCAYCNKNAVRYALENYEGIPKFYCEEHYKYYVLKEEVNQ